MTTSTLQSSFAKAFHNAEMPLVHAFGPRSSNPQVHIVGIDNVECGRIPARALAQRNYRRVGFLRGSASATLTRDRLDSFLEELTSHSQIRVSHLFCAVYSFDTSSEEMQRLLTTNMPAEAYFCDDDVLSIGTLSAITSAGLSVPSNIGLIGLKDMEITSWKTLR